MTKSAKLISLAAVLAIALVATLAVVLTSGSGRDNDHRLAPDSARAAEASASGHFKSRPDLAPPKMVIKKHSKRASKQKIFVGFKHEGNGIYTANGQPVWFFPSHSTDFRVQRFRGKPVLTWVQTPGPGSGIKRNTDMIANRNYKIIKRVHPGNGLVADQHEFRLTNRGTAFLTTTKKVYRNLSAFGLGSNAPVSNAIAQEVNLRTGKVVWQWNSLAHVPLRDTYAEMLRHPGLPFDYFHINSISEAPDGNIIISGRSTNAVYKVSRKTGRIIWTLGGKSSDFKMGKGAYFSSQHDAELHKNGVMTIFDNGNSPVISKPVREQSRGLTLKLNFRKMKAREVKTLTNPARPLASQQGNVQDLRGGHAFVGWGGVPLISEYAGGGKLLFDAAFPTVPSFYRAYKSKWTGHPKTKPAVAARFTRSGHTRLWVSWNGDSRVRRWKVKAGNGKHSLKKVANRRRKGFETAIAVPHRYRYLRVYGISRKHKKIGRSKLIRVG